MKKYLFIFDMGSVLVENDEPWPEAMKALGLPSSPKENSPYIHLYRAAARGDITSMEFSLLVAERAKLPRPTENYWKKFFRPTLKTETAKLIKAIKKSDARIVCGTNTFDVYYDYLSEAGFYADFDKVYASCFMHTRKPDVSFWQYIRNEEKTYDFSDMLFFDDSEANVRAAESLGIHAHRFTGADKAKEFILSVLGNDCKIDFNKF